MSEKIFRVIDGFNCENKPCKLIENTITAEQYNTENELEVNSLCALLNRLMSENRVFRYVLDEIEDYDIDKLLFYFGDLE